MPDFTAETRPSALVLRADILASGATSASHFAARWLNVSSNPINVVIFYVSTPDTPFLDPLHH